MSEIVTAERWLYETLTGDAAIAGMVGAGVYSDAAPSSATYPMVLFAMLSATDLRVVGPARIWSNMLYVVRGIHETSSKAALDALASRIDAVLHAAAGSTDGGSIYACVRERPYQLSETLSGRRFMHLGGVYRLFVK